MEQHSLVLCGKKYLEWKKEEIGVLQEDELLIKTIAGAISIGAELTQQITIAKIWSALDFIINNADTLEQQTLELIVEQLSSKLEYEHVAL